MARAPLVAALLAASACGPNASDERDSCRIALVEVAAYQAVKTTLAREGEPGLSPAELIAGWPVLFRAFVRPDSALPAGPVEARLTLRGPAGDTILLDRKEVDRASADAALSSTFNFEAPTAALRDGATWSVAITSPAGCHDDRRARFPSTGQEPLRTRRTGVLKLRLIPIRYEADGSGRLPDMSEAQIERYRAQLLSLFPAEGVEIAVREPVSTAIDLGVPAGWMLLLDALRDVRSKDEPPADVYYFGLVAPAVNVGTYCQKSCVAGLSFIADASAVPARVGVGIGFSGGTSADAMAHELGHMHGRLHAPCDANTDIDPHYPHPRGEVGAWGYDATARSLTPPTRKDLMGYCAPRWISAYTFRALADRIALVSTGGSRPAVPPMMGSWRTLLRAPDGKTRWGEPVTGVRFGSRDVIEVQTEGGTPGRPIDVFRSDLSDGSRLYLVPASAW